eukprot:4992437-Pyramimonas_sp.AAC.1
MTSHQLLHAFSSSRHCPDAEARVLAVVVGAGAASYNSAEPSLQRQHAEFRPLVSTLAAAASHAPGRAAQLTLMCQCGSPNGLRESREGLRQLPTFAPPRFAFLRPRPRLHLAVLPPPLSCGGGRGGSGGCAGGGGGAFSPLAALARARAA